MAQAPAGLPRLGRHNPRLARLRRLCRGDEPGLTVVDGPKLVAELLGRGVEVLELYVTPERTGELLADAAAARLAAAGAAFEVDAATAARLAPTRSSQGVLAVVAVPRREVAAAGVAAYLDRVQDPGNVGAVVRSAAAFGAGGVICSPGCGSPFSPKAVRASAGLSLLFPVQTAVPIGVAAGAFLAAGGEVAVAVGSGGREASGWRPRAPLLLVLGNEGAGPDEEVLRHATERLTLPLTAVVESLNVAVTAGILLAALRGVVPSPILDRDAVCGGPHDSPP